MHEPADRLIATELERNGFEILPLSLGTRSVLDMSPIHADPFDRLLAAQAIDESGTRLTRDPVDIVFSDTNVLVPDLLFIPAARMNIVTEMNIQGAPAFVVEVVSDSNRDRVRKRDASAKFGVGEYWIVDPDADRVEVLLASEDRYAKPDIYEPGEVLTTKLLPGLSVNLTDLFAR